MWTLWKTRSSAFIISKMWSCHNIIHNYKPTQSVLTNSTRTVILFPFLLNTPSTNCLSVIVDFWISNSKIHIFSHNYFCHCTFMSNVNLSNLKSNHYSSLFQIIVVIIILNSFFVKWRQCVMRCVACWKPAHHYRSVTVYSARCSTWVSLEGACCCKHMNCWVTFVVGHPAIFT